MDRISEKWRLVQAMEEVIQCLSLPSRREERKMQVEPSRVSCVSA